MLHNPLQYKSINDNDNNRDWINTNKISSHMFVNLYLPTIRGLDKFHFNSRVVYLLVLIENFHGDMPFTPKYITKSLGEVHE